MKKSQFKLLTTLSLLVLCLTLVDSTRIYARLDLSRDQVFSLSPATGKLLADLKNPVFVTYYASKNFVDSGATYSQMIDILGEFKNRAKSNFNYAVIDPIATATEDKVQEKGIIKFPTPTSVGSSSQYMYSGLIIEYLGKFKVLPYCGPVLDASGTTVVLNFQPTDNLEFMIDRAVESLVTNTDMVIGVMAGEDDVFMRDFTGGQAVAASAEKLLSLFYQYSVGLQGLSMQAVNRGVAIPADVRVLIVLGSQDISEKDAYYIDQYIMSGGRVLFGVRGLNLSAQGALIPTRENYLTKLLASYGISAKPDIAMDESSFNVTATQASDGIAVGDKVSFYFYPIVKPSESSGPFSSRLGNTLFFWPSPLEVKPVDGLKTEVIASTTDQGWAKTKDFNYPQSPTDLEMMKQEQSQTKGKQTLGVTLSGKFKSLFKDAGPSVAEGEAKLPVIPESPETRIAVVGDYWFMMLEVVNYYIDQNLQKVDLDGQLWFTDVVTSWLGLDNANLISAKKKSNKDLHLNKIEDKQTEGTMVVIAYIIVFGLTPIGIVGFGVFRFRRRKLMEKSGRVQEAGNELSE